MLDRAQLLTATADDLITACAILADPKYVWKTNANGAIRNQWDQCPGCALAEVYTGLIECYTLDPWLAFAAVIGEKVSFDAPLYGALSTLVVAADRRHWWSTRANRARLLQTLGLPAE